MRITRNGIPLNYLLNLNEVELKTWSEAAEALEIDDNREKFKINRWSVKQINDHVRSLNNRYQDLTVFLKSGITNDTVKALDDYNKYRDKKIQRMKKLGKSNSNKTKIRRN